MPAVGNPGLQDPLEVVRTTQGKLRQFFEGQLPEAELIQYLQGLDPLVKVSPTMEAAVATSYCYCSTESDNVLHTFVERMRLYFPRALHNGVSEPWFLWAAGKFAELTHDHAQAISLWARVGPESQNYVSCQYSIGTSYEEQKKWPEAMKQYEAVLARDPGHETAMKGLARCKDALRPKKGWFRR